jgi:hypothetical protein
MMTCSMRRGSRPEEIEGVLAGEDWPTTQRFSRRAGEAFRGSDYAAAVEAPAGSGVSDAAIAIGMVVGALLGAAVMVLWQV